MSNVSLTSAMSSNLLALKQTTSLMSMTQNRLATGLKVNSAIDNPSAYYTAVSLNNRAADLNSLLDNMGQAIQTVKAAVEAVETATSFLEQMSSIAEQAVSQPTILPTTRPIEEFITEDYKVISANMSMADIQALISDNAKLVLTDDIILTEKLQIAANNVTIDGNGHKLKFTGTTTGENLIKVSGSNAKINNLTFEYQNDYGGAAVLVTGSAEMTNFKIAATGTGVYGLQAKDGGSVKLDSATGISVSGVGAMKLTARDEVFFNGKANTQAIINQIGAEGLVATAAHQFYVGNKNDANFGQGQWYVPAEGELMEAYGYDASQITAGRDTSGMTGENKKIINAALSTLQEKGDIAESLANHYYWSSSEYDNNCSWIIYEAYGYRSYYNENSSYRVRVFQFLEDKFNPKTAEAAPQIGDVMYSDLSYGSAEDYNGGKTAVGVVTWVSEDGRSAKIMNLKDLTFSSVDSVNNFNPANPYGESYDSSYHTTGAKYSEDITGIPNYNNDTFLSSIKSEGNITVSSETENSNVIKKIGVATEWSETYNDVLNQYDMLIDDASYKGINLLKGEQLNVIFNGDKSSCLNILGKDIHSSSLGLSAAEWRTIADVSVAIAELQKSVAALRSLSSELGNNYSVVQSRQDFTESLINILTEGADKLTLADMNEESAIMLALQTRQQLAINSLSLASQSAQSVLRLFA